ncbi:unnamed protein product [Closterium sp. NIES-53]
MYVMSTSGEGAEYLRVPPDPGIRTSASAAPGTRVSATPGAGEAAALGACASAPPGTESLAALHTFTLDSGASRCFFRDRTALEPLARPVAVSLADPSGGPVIATSSTVLPCPAVPSGTLSGLHLPSFSTNLVAGCALQDGAVGFFANALDTPGDLRREVRDREGPRCIARSYDSPIRSSPTYSSPQATPLPTRHSLSALPSDESIESSGPYPELVGCLMYLMTCTRPDLAYPLSILARYVAPGRHRPEHMAAAKRVLRYLCSTSGMGLVLGGQSPVVLTGHANASWADDQATQRSSQGYTFSLGSGSVSWRATRSSSVLGSSCEAEIYAGAMAAQELCWLTYLLTDLGEPPRSPLVLYVDNKAMLALCREQRLEHRTKHIALRYFLARELQQRGQLRLAYVASEANTADVFTKALAPCDHQRFCTQLACSALPYLTGLVTPSSPHFAYGGTYVGAVPPSRANIVNRMWIFRVKRLPGSPPVFKARYVARGFRQRQGVDFYHTFSPTPKMTTLRVLLHVAAHRDYELHSPDFSTAFLYLRRPVYGLRQAPREWHDTLKTMLAALGFTPSTADPSLFLRTDISLPPFYVLVYVLKRFGFRYSSPQCTPLRTGHSLSASPSDESVEPSGPYPELVGCLVYLMTCTIFDLAYPLSILARYVVPRRHRPEHWEATKRVLHYLCSTSGMGLVLGGRGPIVLTRHADASWVDALATQRSSQGYTFSLGSGSVSWPSTRSSSILSSSCEAEIYAGAMATQELCWLTYLLIDLGERPRSSPVLYVDNKAMIALCQEHRLEHKTKHIALRYFLAGELQQCGLVAIYRGMAEALQILVPYGDFRPHDP